MTNFKSRLYLTSVCGGSGTPKSGQVVKWKWRIVRTAGNKKAN